MDRFLASIPQPILIIGAIVIGFVLIVVNDPPRTVCDGQLDVIRESQEEFLFFRRGAGGATKPALINDLIERCRADNSPGGCFELFQRLKKMNVDLTAIPGECSDDTMKVANIKGGLFSSIELMVQIAWGEKGPSSSLRRNGWLDASDVALFCDLKKSGLRFVGSERFDTWKATVVSKLPGAELLDGDQPYQRSLFSTPCSEYR